MRLRPKRLLPKRQLTKRLRPRRPRDPRPRRSLRRPVPTVLTVIGIVASMILLGLAARTIPIGTAYAIWVGIGAVGAVVLGIILFDEPRDFARMAFVALLIVSLIGLKLTTKN